MPRYALFFAPVATSDLWRFGSRVLGYDAATGEDMPFYSPAGAEDWERLTAEPRTYGFHATLKAPIHLAEGHVEADLLAAVESYAETTASVVLDGLEVTNIGPFFALTPVGDATRLNALAASVVIHFDHFRAPLSEKDRARRLAAPLTERQIANLDRFGYPYVLDDFRFHMTLTGPIHADLRDGIRAHLEERFEAKVAGGPVTIDALTVFRQDEPGGRFRIIARAPFKPAA
jgi:putative phosphonate metabolism protein